MTTTSAAEPAGIGSRIGRKLEQGSAAGFRRGPAIGRRVETGGAASTRPIGATGKVVRDGRASPRPLLRWAHDVV